MSLITTPPPRPLSELSVPIKFILAKRDFIPGYSKNLFMQLPVKIKSLKEIDGGVFWMLSNPMDAAETVCKWIWELKIITNYKPVQA